MATRWIWIRQRLRWPRALDMNDRALRNIVVSVTAPEKAQRDGSNRATGFVITAASEIMAILALAKDRIDLRARLARIIVGSNRAWRGGVGGAAGCGGADDGAAERGAAAEPGADDGGNSGAGALRAICEYCAWDEFGDLAGDGAATGGLCGERDGFASDLGVEKYLDLVMPSSGIKPSVAVLVSTVQSLRNQGEGDLERGLKNLEKHMSIVRGFRLPVVVAINRFPKDTEAELDVLKQFCEARGAAFALSEAFAKGGEGAAALAAKVVEVLDANPDVDPVSTYDEGDSALEKITKVARSVYGADGIVLSERAQENLARLERWGFGNFPVCIAKTQYSLSDDPKLSGAPTGWTLRVSDISLSAGAGFLVVTSGAMMLMPGLPKASRALDIDVDASGEIVGMS